MIWFDRHIRFGWIIILFLIIINFAAMAYLGYSLFFDDVLSEVTIIFLMLLIFFNVALCAESELFDKPFWIYFFYDSYTYYKRDKKLSKVLVDNFDESVYNECTVCSYYQVHTVIYFKRRSDYLKFKLLVM